MYITSLVLFTAMCKMALSTSNFITKSALFIRFRVVSYNILADLYADSEVSRTQLFPYCPPYALSIDYRKQLILKELLGEFVKQSVLCLGIIIIIIIIIIISIFIIIIIIIIIILGFQPLGWFGQRL